MVNMILGAGAALLERRKRRDQQRGVDERQRNAEGRKRKSQGRGVAFRVAHATRIEAEQDLTTQGRLVDLDSHQRCLAINKRAELVAEAKLTRGDIQTAFMEANKTVRGTDRFKQASANTRKHLVMAETRTIAIRNVNRRERGG